MAPSLITEETAAEETRTASSTQTGRDITPMVSNRLLSAMASRITASWYAVVFLTLLYAFLIAAPMHRRLWFDELFTYYIAQSPTLSQLHDASIHVDLNPPLIYWLVRLSQSLFGLSEFAARLPAALGFYFGSVITFLFLRRKIGVVWGASAIVLFWSTPYFRYSAQARPYGLLIFFFSMTLAAYDEALSAQPGRWAVPRIAAGNIGMMLSHAFAPLSVFPFCAAEMVRSFMIRRIEWRIWAGLLLPLTLVVLYLPETRNFQKFYFPASYQASGQQMEYFLIRLVILNLFPGIAFVIVSALVAIPLSPRRILKFSAGWPAATWAAALLAVPVILNLILMRTAGAFWDRYVITSALAFYTLVVVALGRITGFRRSSGIAVALAVCTLSLLHPFEPDSQTPNPGQLDSVRQDLPLVTASGLTFLEMDRYEKREMISRLYYLTDRAAGIQYAHSTVFENMPLLKHYFPIRANVASYSAFVSAHPHFLVLTKADFKEEWVLHKLRADGASVKLNQVLAGPGKDFELYEVER